QSGWRNHTTLRCCSTAGFAASPRSRAAADTASACSSESRRTRIPVARRSTTISADSSTMRPASAAPSISEGTANHAVATPSTTRQSGPISVMPCTVEPIPDDLLPDSDHVPAGALMDAVGAPRAEWWGSRIDLRVYAPLSIAAVASVGRLPRGSKGSRVKGFSGLWSVPQPGGPTHVGPPRVAPAGVGPSEVGPPEVGPGHAAPPGVAPAGVGPPEIGPSGAAPASIRPSEVGPPEVRPARGGPAEVSPGIAQSVDLPGYQVHLTVDVIGAEAIEGKVRVRVKGAAAELDRPGPGRWDETRVGRRVHVDA